MKLHELLPETRHPAPVAFLDNGEMFKRMRQRINKDVCKNIKYLCPQDRMEDYLVVERDGKIVGVLGYQKSPYEPDMVWLKFISVHPKYRNQRIAKLLMDSLFKFLLEEGYRLQPSIFSEDGEQYIKKYIEQFDRDYPGIIDWRGQL